MSSVLVPIKNSIANRYISKVVYHGSERIVEPHLLGQYEDGRTALLAWQVSAPSGIGWREFVLDDIERFEHVGEAFIAARPGFNADHPRFRVVVASL